MTTETTTALKASLAMPAGYTKILVILNEEGERTTEALRKRMCMHPTYILQTCLAMQKAGLITDHKRGLWFNDESSLERVWLIADTFDEAIAKLAAKCSSVLPSKAQVTTAEEREQMQT